MFDPKKRPGNLAESWGEERGASMPMFEIVAGCSFGLDHFHCEMFIVVNVVFVIKASLSALVPSSLISLSV